MAIRKFNVNVASRQAVSLKISLSGPSGSGKTTSAVLLSYGLLKGLHPDWTDETIWSKIAVADTENGSSLYIAGETFRVDCIDSDRRNRGPVGKRDVTIGEFLHIPFEPPYDPESWIEVIRVAEQAGAEVLVLDSFSHEWSGTGGVLEIKDKLGGKFQDWAKVSPRHQKVVDAIRNSPMHIVACMRSKSDWVVESYQDGSGATKTKPVKIGTKSTQREDAEYEFGVAFTIEHRTHLASTDKDRTRLFDGEDPHVIGPATGQRLAAWTSSGAAQPGSPYWVAAQVDRIRASVTEEALRAAFGEAWKVGQGLPEPTRGTTLAHLKATYDEANAAFKAAKATVTEESVQTEAA